MPEVNFIIVVLLYEGVDGALRAFVKHVEMCMFGGVCVFKPDQLNRELWFNGLIIVYFYIYLQVLAHTSTHSREHACYS